MFWLKWKPLVEGTRKQFNNPQLLVWFEYLYNEVKKKNNNFSKQVLRMVDLTEISAKVAAAGVPVGVV